MNELKQLRELRIAAEPLDDFRFSPEIVLNQYQKTYLHKKGLPYEPGPDSFHQNVFTDLTDRGFFVTLGLKFGADLLAYTEDPLVCHAKYLVKVVPSGTLAPLDLIQS